MIMDIYKICWDDDSTTDDYTVIRIKSIEHSEVWPDGQIYIKGEWEYIKSVGVSYTKEDLAYDDDFWLHMLTPLELARLKVEGLV
jgi:hypothetical protein